MIHWTGHKGRLNRDQQSYGTHYKSYAYEELVAELGASFLCSLHKITGDIQDAAYIKSWIQLLKNDQKAIFTASSLSQKAMDYLIKKSGIVYWEPDENKEEAA